MASIHFKRHLIHQCVIERNTTSRSSSGEIIDSWASAGTMSCRYVERSERIAAEGVGFLMLQVHRLLCDEDETVNEDDRITTITLVADGSSVDDGPFSIEEKLIRNTTGPHHMSLRLERVK